MLLVTDEIRHNLASQNKLSQRNYMSMIWQINMTEESNRLLRFGVHTLPVSGQTKRSAMLVGGATFSYGSTDDGSNDPCRNSPGKMY